MCGLSEHKYPRARPKTRPGCTHGVPLQSGEPTSSCRGGFVGERISIWMLHSCFSPQRLNGKAVRDFKCGRGDEPLKG